MTWHCNFGRKLDNRGFTILELLIATGILSGILVMMTVMITGIGNLYYKGIAQSQTQDTTRTIVRELTQAIQLNKGVPRTGSTTKNVNGTDYTISAICVGTTRYSYVINLQVGPSGIMHGLWRNTVGSGAPCSPMDLTTDLATSDTTGGELLGQRMRLTEMQPATQSAVNPVLYSIKVSLAYGDDDVLNLSGYDTTCKGGAGGQFCATDRLTSSAIQRIN